MPNASNELDDCREPRQKSQRLSKLIDAVIYNRFFEPH